MWFGRPGAMEELPRPTGDLPHPADLLAGEHALLGGGGAVDYPAGQPARRYTVNWQGITHDEWAALDAYTSRLRGYGPWAMLLPETRRNLLPATMAAGTENGLTTGLSVAGGESLASSTAQAYLGLRSLAWSLPASVSSGLLTLSHPVSAWYGWPSPVGLSWTLSAYVRSGGSDSSFDVRARLRWLSVAGATLSTSDGTYTAQSSGAWTRVSVTATAPASTAYVLPLLQVDGTDVSATATAYIDGVQLQTGALTNLAGLGGSCVSIVEATHEMPTSDWHDVTWTLQEVG
jgi:hypothetical protein